VLIIADYNYNSTAKNKFIEILQIAKDVMKDNHFLNNPRTYNFTVEKGLKKLVVFERGVILDIEQALTRNHIQSQSPIHEL